MKYLKSTSILVLLIAMCFAISSCGLTEPKDRTYQGPTVTEFFPISSTYSYPPSVSGTVRSQVQLIGPQRSEPTTVTIAVVDSLTTAQEGVHYTIQANSVTIPADSSQAVYAIGIDFAQLQPEEAVKVVFRIQDDKEMNNNIDEWEVTLIGEEPPEN